MKKRPILLYLLISVPLMVALAVMMLMVYRRIATEPSAQTGRAASQIKPQITNTIAWREIYPAEGAIDAFIEGIGGTSTMYSGNFDADIEHELLMLTENQLIIFELDGQYRLVDCQVDMRSLYHSFHNAAWDFDRDGIDELFPDPMMWEISESQKEETAGTLAERYAEFLEFSTPLHGIPVFNVDGGVSALLPAKTGTCLPALGDVDGDGYDEMVVCTSKNPDEFVAYGLYGSEVWNCNLEPVRGQASLGFGCFGKFDHDDKEELFQSYLGYWLYGMDQERIELASMPTLISTYDYAADVDDDGYDELVGDKGIIDLNSYKLTEFKFPPGEEPLWGKALFGNFICGEEKEVAVVTSYIQESGRLFMFNLDGKNVYLEEVGERVASISEVKGTDGNHLVMKTQSRILIYP